MIIGITGTLAAGKGTIVEYLKSHGFKHYSVRDFLIKEIEKRGMVVNRDSMVLIADDLRKKNSPGYLAEKIYENVQKGGGDAVIESLRSVGEVEVLKKKENFYLFSVDAEINLRYKRAVKRKGVTDEINFEKFISDEKKEMENEDLSKGNIKKCMEMADFKFKNNGTFEELYEKVERVLEKINANREKKSNFIKF